jgi:hypothetical protein
MKTFIGFHLTAAFCGAILFIGGFSLLPRSIQAGEAEVAAEKAKEAVEAAEQAANAAAKAQMAADEAGKKAGMEKTLEDKNADAAGKAADDAAKAADQAQDEAQKQKQEADDAANDAKKAGGSDEEKNKEAAKQEKEADEAAAKAKEAEDDAREKEKESDEADKKADAADRKIQNRDVKKKKAAARALRKKALAARRAAAQALRDAYQKLHEREKREGKEESNETRDLEKLLEGLKYRLQHAGESNEIPKQPSATPPSTGQTSQTKTANGLSTVTFDTINGQVIVNLPDDIRAGDTISGTVFEEPKGSTPAEREQSKAALEGLVIDIGGTVIPSKQSRFTVQPAFDTVPNEIAAGQTQSIVITIRNGNQSSVDPPLARAVVTPNPRIILVSISLPPITPPQTGEPPSGAVTTPEPKITPRFEIPPLGQQGRPLVITGPFDGNSANTMLNWTAVRSTLQDFEKNTENVSGRFGLIAESPRQAVFQSPTKVSGPIQITLTEGNTQTTGAYRNVGVNLSAPKTSLMKGEQTTLTVNVSGLEGIKSSVPLTLDSQGVITMEGGSYQSLVIQPSQVDADGRYSTTLGITGVQTGAWGVVATVVTQRFDVCLQDDSVPATVVLLNTFNGDYIFMQLAGESLSGQGTITKNGCIITLTDSLPDRKVQGQLDPCMKTGSASAQSSLLKIRFAITDRNITDNTCTAR